MMVNDSFLGVKMVGTLKGLLRCCYPAPGLLPLLLPLLLLGACASLPQKDDIQSNFLLKMRVGFSSSEQAGSANLRWQQSGSDYDAVLSANTELARMRRSGENRSLFISEELRSRVDTQGFPLEYLEYWINLMPAPGPPAEINRNSYGQIIAIRQDGWHITYRKREKGFPRLIRAEKPPYRVTLAIMERKAY